MLNGRERYYFLLDLIDEARYGTPSDEPIQLHLARHLKNEFTPEEFERAVRKLEADGMVRLHAAPSISNGQHYEIIVCPKFDVVLNLTKHDPDYIKFTTLNPKPQPPSGPTPIAATDGRTVNHITYDHRKIFINGELLAKPDFDSENERFFSYIYEHPNEKIPLKKIREAIGGFKKTIHSILAGLGFKGNTRKLFFDASKSAVIFHNPARKEMLDAKGPTQLRLNRDSEK